MSELKSTPFAKWIEDGDNDPHGNYYSQDVTNIACGHYPHYVVSFGILHGGEGHSNIFWLTAGKERLRWLSRKLHSLTSDHIKINQRRASLLNGGMTDDQLANQFFLTEAKEDLQAGHMRMAWLIKEINKLEKGA